MNKQQASDLLRIAFRLRYLAECMMGEGLTNYSLTLSNYANWIEEVVW